MTTPPQPAADDDSALPLYVAGALVGVEGAAAAGYGLWGGAQALTDPSVPTGGAILTTILLVGIGVLLVVVGAGLVRARRWSRAPAVVGQILLGAFAYDLVSRGEQGAGVAVLVVALACLVLIFRRSSTARLQRPTPDS